MPVPSVDKQSVLSLEAGRAYALAGPAVFVLEEGEMFSLGAALSAGKRYSVPSGETAYWEASRASTVRLIEGTSGGFRALERPGPPKSWEAAAAAVSAEKGRAAVFPGLGGSSEVLFLTYLANKLQGKGRRVSVIDGSLDRPFLGPPACLGLLAMNDPVFWLSTESPTLIGYLGRHAPGDIDEAREELERLMAWSAKRRQTEHFLLYLPGWFGVKNGRLAPARAADLLKKAWSAVPLGASETARFRHAIPKGRFLEFEPFGIPAVLPKAPGADRRELIRRYYKDRRFLMLPFHRVRTEDCRFLSGKRVKNMPPGKVIYAEIFSSADNDELLEMQAAVRESLTTGEVEGLKKEFSVVKVHQVTPGVEAGVQVGLCNGRGETLELGIVQRIDYEGRYIEVWSPLAIGKEDDVERVRFSSIRVSWDGDELDALPEGTL